VKLRLAVAVAVAALAGGAVVATAAFSPLDRAPGDEIEAMIERSMAKGSMRGGASRLVADNFVVLGHNDLGRFPQAYGDVWLHRDYAYVGTRCGFATPPGGLGVQVVDAENLTNPQVVATLSNDFETSVEDVVVRTIRTPFFHGDLAVAGVQACGTQATKPTGLRFYDVSDPSAPRLLSEWQLPAGAIGCHEIDLVQRKDRRVFAACARNYRDQDVNGVNTKPGAVKIVEVTDPTAPQERGSWELPAETGVGCRQYVFAHSVRFTSGGRELYVSYWDAGTVRLNIVDPAHPVQLARVKITPLDEEGENHSVTLANGGRWLVINPEDDSVAPCPAGSGTWGEAYVYDNANPAAPVFLTRFATAHGASGLNDGAYTVHNTESNGANLFSSWYSDGIIWWTIENGVPRQLGQFVPDPGPTLTAAFTWGVALDVPRRAVFASDIGSGLWIVRPSGGLSRAR
jgi:hypothetical protein